MGTTTRGLLAGLAGGAAGTTALNAVTYLDMAVRGRATSSTPEDSIEKLAHKVGTDVPGDEQTRPNRLSGLGALTGILAGVGVGGVYGLARAAGWRPKPMLGAVLTAAFAMAGTSAPMAALDVTDPRTWSPGDWLTDLIPHLAYGAVTAATADAVFDR